MLDDIEKVNYTAFLQSSKVKKKSLLTQLLLVLAPIVVLDYVLSIILSMVYFLLSLTLTSCTNIKTLWLH